VKKHVDRGVTNSRKRCYTEEERDAIKGNMAKQQGGLIWPWIQSTTEKALEENRSKLREALATHDRAYFDAYWRPKELQLISCFVR